MHALSSLTDLSDRDLLEHVKRLGADERQATAALIASLAEMDIRRLYLGEGCSSLFTWCTQVLHLSEHAAYARIEAARAARSFPLVLERLAAGEVTLTAVGLLRPHLTDANHRELLDAVRYKSKRDVEHLVAALHPRPDVAPTIRKLPAARPVAADAHGDRTAGALMGGDGVRTMPSGSGEAPPTGADPPVVQSSLLENRERAPSARRAVVAPLAPARYQVQFTVGRATHDKLRRAQDLLRHAVPDGDPAEIFDRALTLLVAHLEKTTLARTSRPRASRSLSGNSRRIPAAVRRTVWKRDGGQCAFVGRAGRCTERAFLEFHHVVPYARGGAATVENIHLRCRGHNQYEAEQDFGRRNLVVRERPPAYESPSVSVRRRPERHHERDKRMSRLAVAVARRQRA